MGEVSSVFRWLAGVVTDLLLWAVESTATRLGLEDEWDRTTYELAARRIRSR
jgi:hypothetical protein